MGWIRCDVKIYIVFMGTRGPKSKFTDIAYPNVLCPDYGMTDMGNIAGNGTYETQNEKVRKFICRTCGKSFNSRSGTVFYDLRTKKDTFILALKMVLSDIPLRKISYILDVKLDTVRDWLLRAANHSEKVNDIFLKDLEISKEERWIWVGFAK